jgi:protein NrfD
MNTQLLETVTHRANRGIDPSLEIWGWEIALYLFLGGLVAGMLVLASSLELRGGERPRSLAIRLAPFSALLLLSLGMGALFLDLSHKLFVWRFYLAFKPLSPMSWGSWILLVVYPAALLLGLGSLLPEERERLREKSPAFLRGLLARASALSDANRRFLLLANVVLGVGLGIYTGLLLGTMASRIAWNTAVLGPLFLTSGISTGAAFLLLFRLEDPERKTLARWDAAAIGVELVLIALMMVGFSTAGGPGRLAAGSLLGGPYTAVFWSLVVVLGLLVPLTMELVETRRHLPFVVLTPALVLAGGLALRAILLLAGQESAFRHLP